MSVKSLLDICILNIDGANYQPFLTNFEHIKSRMHILWGRNQQIELLKEYKTWHKNGNLHRHFYYRNRILNAGLFEFYDNGNQRGQCFYTDGKLNGEYKMWYENGELNMIICYTDGIYNGKLITYTPDGDIICKMNFE